MALTPFRKPWLKKKLTKNDSKVFLGREKGKEEVIEAVENEAGERPLSESQFIKLIKNKLGYRNNPNRREKVLYVIKKKAGLIEEGRPDWVDKKIKATSQREAKEIANQERRAEGFREEIHRLADELNKTRGKASRDVIKKQILDKVTKRKSDVTVEEVHAGFAGGAPSKTGLAGDNIKKETGFLNTPEATELKTGGSPVPDNPNFTPGTGSSSPAIGPKLPY